MTHIAKARIGMPVPPSPSANKYKCSRPKRQHQKQFDKDEVSQLVAHYQAGATVYELADQFDCHRTTVSDHLKSRGVKMRLTALTEEQVQEAVRLYESGHSLKSVGQQVGANAETVRSHMRKRGVCVRGPHSRSASPTK